MNYTIYHVEIESPAGQEAVGVEVQPPLHEMAINGIKSELEKRPSGYVTGREHVAESVNVTRNDEAGTAFMVCPNTYNRNTSMGIARAIGDLIDPCGIHTIEYKDSLSNIHTEPGK